MVNLIKLDGKILSWHKKFKIIHIHYFRYISVFLTINKFGYYYK